MVARASKEELSEASRRTLETRILPKARRWVEIFAKGSPLHEHGKKTLEYWDREPETQLKPDMEIAT